MNNAQTCICGAVMVFKPFYYCSDHLLSSCCDQSEGGKNRAFDWPVALLCFCTSLSRAVRVKRDYSADDQNLPELV